MTRAGTTSVPCRLTRLGVVMSADPDAGFEAEGVLNPASGRSPDGRLWLLPRLVAAGNVSRIGIAEVLVRDGQPAGVRRDGVVLAPDAGWERSHDHAGVEDPRTTWIASLGVHVMSYVAFGPLGPRPALAVSEDLRSWRRLGPVHFEYQPELDADLNLFTNKDVVYFPEAVPGPDGRLAYAMLHRPTWDLGAICSAEVRSSCRPAWMTRDRESGSPTRQPMRWMRTCGRSPMSGRTGSSHCPSTTTRRSRSEPARRRCASRRGGCSFITASREHWPRDGVRSLTRGTAPARCCSTRTIPAPSWPAPPARCSSRWPLEEREGTMPNVVFPTAIEEIDGQRFVFYGMADSSIGVARLDGMEAP